MENIGSYIIGILGIVFLMLAWTLVQTWWRKTFSDELSYDRGDEDVMAHRTDCGNCGCTTMCSDKKKRLSINTEIN